MFKINWKCKLARMPATQEILIFTKQKKGLQLKKIFRLYCKNVLLKLISKLFQKTIKLLCHSYKINYKAIEHLNYGVKKMFSTLKLRFTTTNLRSSLFYNTSARHERHECDTSATGVRHKCDMNNTSATRVLHERHECDTREKF